MGTPRGQAIVPEGVKAAVAFVPTGVKFTVPFVPAGVPALTADVVPEDPVKVACWTAPEGVIVALPPVVPTSAFAARVPRSILPFRAETSVNPVGQVPLKINVIRPLGIAPEEVEYPCAATHCCEAWISIVPLVVQILNKCDVVLNQDCPATQEVGSVATEFAYEFCEYW